MRCRKTSVRPHCTRIERSPAPAWVAASLRVADPEQEELDPLEWTPRSFLRPARLAYAVPNFDAIAKLPEEYYKGAEMAGAQA